MLAGETVTFDRPVQTLRGRREAMVTFVPDRDAAGVVQGCPVVLADITERKQAEDPRRLSEARVRGLLNALTSGVVVHAPDTRVLDANPSACRILGLPLEQIRSTSGIDPVWRFVEEDRQPMPQARLPVNQVRASGRALDSFPVGLRRSDRAVPLWALCNAFPVFDAEGELQQIVVTYADVTERKEAQEELRRGETRLRMASRLTRLGG